MAVTRRSFARRLTAASFAGALAGRAPAQVAGTFRHGVASGDPLRDRVIIWTRITPAGPEAVIPVEWTISDDPSMRRILQHGLTYTNGAFDCTVKVDVTRLSPATTYYYQFSVRGELSPVGRTRTLTAGQVDRLRFAVVSCSNYPYGFFNSYRAIAARADLDVVLHLGDYIYEYGNGAFGDGTVIGRIPAPNKETIALDDYRQRYAQYRSDPDLQEAHRQHPWIAVWDDHESANNSYISGAENHTPATEGDWYARKYVAAQAWEEWMPVRRNPYLDGQIYRSFRFGNLADLVMLDTRLAGRVEQVASDSPLLLDPGRTILGTEQEGWLNRELSSSKERNTRWRILGQQVMMGQLFNPDGTPFNPDQWDGYVASRVKLLQYLGANSIGNVVVLAGDIHSSWGNEISVNPFSPALSARLAVEFVAPAVTSPGIDNLAQATTLQGQILATHPHVKFVDLYRRGYLLLDITTDRAQAEWYHVTTITQRSTQQDLARVLLTASGDSHLTAGTASSPISGAPPLAV